ncbi:MAG TPA: FKBP-type peptidyl-prolyl cis-trans isomerase [Galbitalea sp.]
MRKIASFVIAAALLASLAACTSSPSTNASAAIDGCKPVQPGTVSNAVKVSGDYGKEPKVTLKAPIGKVKSTQRTVVSLGKGKVAKQGAKVNVDFAIYNGTTGKQLTSTKFSGQTVPFTIDATQFLPGLIKTLKCSPVGSRVVGVIPPTDAFKTTGSSDLGVGAKDEIVFVADVVSFTPTPLKTATGDVQKPQAGFPAVTVNAKGVPAVAIPKTAQPSAFKEEVLVKGHGKKIGSGANVVVNYQLYLWRTGKVVAGNDTWAAGSTATFNTAQVVPGFTKALEGQTIGSRVLVIIPPALGYKAAGQPTAGIKGTDDLVFVVDLLGLS